jgi:hypothetical protein
VSLALLTARIYDKPEHVDTIIDNTSSIGKDLFLNENDMKEIQTNIKATVPLKPIISVKNKEFHANWVTHTEIKRAQQSNIDNILNQKDEESDAGFGTTVTNEANGFNFGKEDASTISNTNTNIKDAKKKIESKWNDDEDEEDEEIQKILEEKAKNSKNIIQSLTIGEDDNIYRKFINSSLPGVQVALGNFRMTLNYLKSQLGINSNYETLKGVMKDLYMSSYSQIQFIPSVPVSELLIRQTKENGVLPQNGLNLRSINQKLNIAYDFITENNMPDAMKVFKDILKYSIFFIAADKTEETRIKEIISICSEYIYLTRLNMKADELKSDKVKYAEICCIMTTCKLEVPIHKFLIYKKAKAACKVIKNFITALVFIKKMLMFEKEVK